MSEITSHLFTDDDRKILARTQAARLSIVDHFMSESGNAPRNQGEWSALNQALDGLDRNIFTKAKLKSDEENSQHRQQILEMVTSVLQQTQVVLTQAPPIRIEPLLDASHTVETVPGETDIGLHEMTYDGFIKMLPEMP